MLVVTQKKNRKESQITTSRYSRLYGIYITIQVTTEKKKFKHFTFCQIPKIYYRFEWKQHNEITIYHTWTMNIKI